MLDWLNGRGSRALNRAAGDTEVASAEATKQQECVMSGRYLSLYKYLENRYADMVVLTFAEIEDLLGFTLPDLARLQREWWTSSDANIAGSTHSDSWTLASRTATPNLLAQTVTFERTV